MTPARPAGIIGLIALAMFWALYGLTGRDAWQVDEAVALAAVLDWRDGIASPWVTPAPLYTLVAGGLAWLAPFGLGAQDSARLASGVFTLLALLATGLAARSLLGPGFATAAVLALMGGFGLMLRAHALLPETALMATWAVLLWGIGLARSRALAGGLILGLALAALTLGLRGLPDLMAALILLALPLGFASWRERSYLHALGIALTSAMALMLAAAAWLAWSGQWQGWWQGHGFAHALPLVSGHGLMTELAWFAWPLWPLALVAVWHDHRRLTRSRPIQVPLLATPVLLLAALVPAWSGYGGLLPLLVPLALLAALALEGLRRGAAQAFYWFGVLCFMFFGFAFWVHFAAVEWGVPSDLARHVDSLTPNYVPGAVGEFAFWLAVAATLLWLLAIPLFPRAQLRPVLVWATGMVLTWILLISLFRPWLEAGWGYRPMLAELAQHLPAGACLSADIPLATTTMLRYHLPQAYRAAPAAGCAYHLETFRRDAPAAPVAGPGEVVWEGYRPRHDHQGYRLIRRDAY